MKRADLEALGLEKEQVDKIMSLNGADIESKKEEIKQLKEERDNANKQLNEANDKLKGLDDKDDTIKDLQDKVQKYVDAEKERKEQEKRKKADDDLNERISSVIPTGNEFSNELIKKGVYDAVKQLVKENDTLNIKEAFEQVTKNQDGIFKNKQQVKIDIPGANTDGNTKFTREEIERMTPDEINKNWADIKASGIL